MLCGVEDVILRLIHRGDVELEVSSSATAALETAPSSLLRHEGGIARKTLESTHNNDLESFPRNRRGRCGSKFKVVVGVHNERWSHTLEKVTVQINSYHISLISVILITVIHKNILLFKL